MQILNLILSCIDVAVSILLVGLVWRWYSER